jgi:hypothetical protein
MGRCCCACDAEQTGNRLKAGRFHNLMAGVSRTESLCPQLPEADITGET